MRKIIWLVAAVALIAIPAVIGLVALRGDDSSSEARRAGALVDPGSVGSNVAIEGATRAIMAPGEAIDVESWSWGVSNTSTAYSGGTTGGTVGKAQLGNFEFVKKVDKASPKLFLAVTTGTHYPKAILRLNRGTEKSEYLVITLEDVLISSVQMSGGGGSDLPTEQVTLDYAKATIGVTETDAPAPVEHSWDLRTSKAG